MTTEVIARIVICGATGVPGSTNCGSSAVKNTMAFGLDACKINPSRNMRPERASFCGEAAGRTSDFPNSARSPKKMRYAAPIHLMAKNKWKDASSTVPTPAAESTKYTVLAARIPRFENRLLRVPERNALESTNSTAGPGVRQRTVSVPAKSHQVAGLTNTRTTIRNRAAAAPAVRATPGEPWAAELD